jgi:HEAT repeats
MPFPLDNRGRQFIEQHFGKKGDFSWTEDFLLRVIDTSGSKYDLREAAIGLREVGIERALEPLRALLMYPNQDVQAIAILTIAHIAGARATPILVDTLENPAYRQKHYALWAIADAADERAIPAVLRYFHKNKNRLKHGRVKHTPILHVLDYILRFLDTGPSARTMLGEVAEIWFGLPVHDRKMISRKHPELAKQLEEAARSQSPGIAPE